MVRMYMQHVIFIGRKKNILERKVDETQKSHGRLCYLLLFDA